VSWRTGAGSLQGSGYRNDNRRGRALLVRIYTDNAGFTPQYGAGFHFFKMQNGNI
jgi:hypothetical protein